MCAPRGCRPCSRSSAGWSRLAYRGWTMRLRATQIRFSNVAVSLRARPGISLDLATPRRRAYSGNRRRRRAPPSGAVRDALRHCLPECEERLQPARGCSVAAGCSTNGSISHAPIWRCSPPLFRRGPTPMPVFPGSRPSSDGTQSSRRCRRCGSIPRSRRVCCAFWLDAGPGDRAFRDAEPGKILHEMRRGEMARCVRCPSDATTGASIPRRFSSCSAGAYEERTGDPRLVDEIWANLLAAIGWIERRLSRSATGFWTIHAARVPGSRTRDGRTVTTRSFMPTAAFRQARSPWSRCRAMRMPH